jgi:glycosyltransferase involved in cell wall biosynthesis
VSALPQPKRPADNSTESSLFTDSQFAKTFGSTATALGVLHVVGYLTDAVFDILGPTCAALHAEGRPQSLLVLQDSTLHRLSIRLNTAIQIHPMRTDGGFVNTWVRLERAFQTMIAEGRWQAVYLHGLMPFVVAAPLLPQVRRSGTRVLLSPHSSRSLRSLKFFAQPVLWALHKYLPLAGIQTIASVPFDVRAMKRLTNMSPRLIEPPVDEIFFSASVPERNSSRTLIGSAAHDAKGAVQRFSQLAVLMAESIPSVRYCWMGPANADEAALLSASGVELLNPEASAYERAEALANACLFLACGEGRGFAMNVAEAMAVGLPCLSWNPDCHSDMLVHNETGLVCRTVEEMALRAYTLFFSPEERAKLGEQARREAVLRFSDQEFRKHIVALFAHKERRRATGVLPTR